MNQIITRLLLLFVCAINCTVELLSQEINTIPTYSRNENSDSSQIKIDKLAISYLSTVNKKVDKYNKAVSSKIESSLYRLTRWENKIRKILEKVDPVAASRLFSNSQITFQTLLNKYRSTKEFANDYVSEFSHYQDKVAIHIKFLQQQKLSVNDQDTTQEKISQMKLQTKNAEFLVSFIKERRKQLISEAYHAIGKSRIFSKLNKESYYYIESIKNYKTILHDRKKTEEILLTVLKKIPAFKEFAANNSQLNGIFPSLNTISGAGSFSSSPIVNGLISRTNVQEYMANSGMDPSLLFNPSMNQNVHSTTNFSDIQKKVEETKETLEELKLPLFKVNNQKTKTFKQRIQTDFDFDFGKSIGYFPAIVNTGVMVGYKLSDKQIAGLGFNYVMGLGSGWRRINFSNEGLGIRTFLRWKVKYDIYLQANAEWNYMFRFNKIEALKNINDWQTAGLAGISKSYKISKKIRGNFQILYNFLHNRHFPNSQPLVIRMGYGI